MRVSLALCLGPANRYCTRGSQELVVALHRSCPLTTNFPEYFKRRRQSDRNCTKKDNSVKVDWTRTHTRYLINLLLVTCSKKREGVRN